jgi:predicted RNA binding protein YcfA (HicA-like mRNA interferase family)
MIADAVDDAGSVEPGRYREPPGHGGAVTTRFCPRLEEYAASPADFDMAVLYRAAHAKAARVLAALKRDGWIESRRSGSHRVLAKGDHQRIWAYRDGVDLGGPAMARIARDYGYTLAGLRKL